MSRLDSTSARVVAVAQSATHTMSKPTTASIELVAGEGVVGDAHRGVTVKHRSRVAADPTQPNLRQVHLIHAELFDELLEGHGLTIEPGAMGENVTTRGLDLLGLARGTRLHLGADAVLEVTGLRNPCGQLNGVQPGLLAATRIDDGRGGVTRKAGIMCVVSIGGTVAAGDSIEVELPTGPHVPLDWV
jgi:MOSC domain-containing protein YiiM